MLRKGHLVNNLMMQIDGIPGHPKIKPLLYDHFVLSRISWHFTIANLGNTWVTENIDNLVASYFRQWLELTISATFNTLIFFLFFSVGYVEERLWWPIQSPNIGRKKKASS